LAAAILKTLAADPNHEFGIALYIEETSSALLEEGSIYPPLQRLDKRGSSTRNGPRRRTAGVRVCIA
jgi:DNA-binding PadR family transcriptional regulator